MKKLNSKYSDLSLWALLFSIIAIVYLNFHYSNWNNPKRIIIHDVQHYYSYLPAIFVYNDVSLPFKKDSDGQLGDVFYVLKSPIGKNVIITSCGMSILYFPFFIIAHIATQFMEYPNDGYSIPYRFALVMSSIFYLLIGAVFLRKFLIKYFSKLVVAITLLVVLLATNLLWYVTFEAPMSHVYSFALISIFMYVIDRWLEHPTIKYTILTGLLIGIISLIRPTNIVIVILLILWKVTSWEALKNRVIFFLERWYLIVIMISIFFIVWSPQLIYWKYVSGSFFYYSYPDEQGFFFMNPQFYSTLFSWRKGFFIYTPVMIFAVIGIGLLYKYKKDFFWPVLVYFLVSWYIISSWWDWWYGGSLGLRPFIDSYGVYSIGLATFLTWLLKRTWLLRTLLLVVFLLATMISGWHFQRYRGGSIHWVAMTREAYFDSFLSKHPNPDFYNKLRKPDYELARKGIYKYEDEAKQDIAE